MMKPNLCLLPSNDMLGTPFPKKLNCQRIDHCVSPNGNYLGIPVEVDRYLNCSLVENNSRG